MKIEAPPYNNFNGFIGETTLIEEIKTTVLENLDSGLPFLITGEKGTGKSMLANAIHKESKWRNKLFIEFNLEFADRQQLNRQLFGWEKYDRSGGAKSFPGKIEQTSTGSLYLSNIDDLEQKHISSIVNLIKKGSYVRVGGQKNLRARCHFILSSNMEIDELCQDRDYYLDLKQINFVHIPVKPIRERKDDILILITESIQKQSKVLNKNITHIDNEAVEWLLDYEWLGNVTEIKSLAHFLLYHAVDGTITLDLVNKFFERQESDEKDPISSLSIDDNLIIFKPGTKLEDVERRMISETLKELNGNRSQAAKALGISLRTLYRKIKTYAIKG